MAVLSPTLTLINLRSLFTNSYIYIYIYYKAAENQLNGSQTTVRTNITTPHMQTSNSLSCPISRSKVYHELQNAFCVHLCIMQG